MRLLRIFAILLAVFVLFVFTFVFIECRSSCKPSEEDISIDFLFETAFTEEEHIQRIRERTNEKLAEDIEKGCNVLLETILKADKICL